MVPLKPFGFLIAASTAGATLALASLAASMPTGWIGAAALIGWAMLARRRWAKLEATTGLEPGAPERVLWLRLAAAGLILGHLAAALALVGDDLHLGHGNSLAIDSWTMLAALPITAVIFRRDRSEQDERHVIIAARGVRVGYAALVAMLVVLLAYLAFTPADMRALLSDFVLANLLVALLLVSHVAALLSQLAAYARDTAAAPESFR